MSSFYATNMDRYETDDILSQALNSVEETEDNAKFITQNTYMYQFDEGNHKCF